MNTGMWVEVAKDGEWTTYTAKVPWPVGPHDLIRAYVDRIEVITPLIRYGRRKRRWRVKQ